ncbi:MAG: hypothetical protein R2752_01585 [Vicinamibacterales bacterium]
MIAWARILLRLYPRSWRERYGAEMAVLLEDVPPRARDLVDLAIGCAGAWLHRTELGETVKWMVRLVTAIVVLVGPAFVLGRVARSFGLAGGATLAEVSQWLFVACAARIFWWTRGQSVEDVEARMREGWIPRHQVAWWRALAFLTATLFFTTDESIPQAESLLSIFGVVFAPQAMVPWWVDSFVPKPWILKRRIRPSRPPAGPVPPGAERREPK